MAFSASELVEQGKQAISDFLSGVSDKVTVTQKSDSDVSGVVNQDKVPVNISDSEKPGESPLGTWKKELPEVRILKEGLPQDYYLIPQVLIHTLRIFESIERTPLVAELIISDINDFTNKMPIDGNEIIELRFRAINSVSTSVLQFEVSHVEVVPKMGPSGKINNVIISLVQFPVWRNLIKNKISKGYKNKLVSDIVEDISYNFLESEKRDISTTQGKLDSYCIPYWRAVSVIEDLKNIAINSDNKGGFLCWNNVFNILNFKSIGELYEQESKYKFYIKDVRNDADRSEQIILDYSTDNIKKEYLKMGLSGNTVSGFDWENKKYISKDIIFSKYSKSNSTDTFALFTDDIDDELGNYAHTAWNSDLFLQGLRDTKMSNSVNGQNMLEVRVRGILQLTSGNVIEIQNSKKDRQTEEDRTSDMEGEWLIKDVNHVWIVNQPFTQKYRLIKNSYFKKPYPELRQE